MGKLLGCTLVLTLALAAGCCCPPSSSSGGRSTGRDSSSVTFAFLGGLRCFFGSDDASAKEDNNARKVENDDLGDKPKTTEETDHAAALTIR